MRNAPIILATVFLFICIAIPPGAQADPPSFQESIQTAIDHAANPDGWIPQNNSIILIPDTSGTDKYGLKYTDAPTNHNLIVRSLTRSTFFAASDFAGKNHTVYKPGPPIPPAPQAYNADFVTTGNDATKFLDDHGVTGLPTGVTGVDVIKLLERGLGINDTGTHDAIIEYTVASDGAGVFINKLMRPTKNPDITVYSKDYLDYADLHDFVKPADMTVPVFNEFKKFYDFWRDKAYYSADPNDDFPWTQLGYTFFWGNGYTRDNIQGMTELIILGGTVVNTYGMYAAQSYIYTKNSGQYGNGYASFDVYGNCDSIWAGHRFQSKTLDQPATNTINIQTTGSVSGGQGILVYSLNYNLTNNGSITGATSDKFGYANTSDIAVLLMGNTVGTYIPAPTGNNTLTNSGTISSPGTAIEVDNGNTTIINNAGGTISGDDIAIAGFSPAGQAIAIDSAGTIYGGNFAVQTGASNDTFTLKGGKSTGNIDLGGGVDTLNVTGATSNVMLGFTVSRGTGGTAKVDNVATVNIADNKATIAPAIGGTDNIQDNDTFLIINAGALTADSTRIAIQNDSTHPMITFNVQPATATQLSIMAARNNSYYTNNCGNPSLGATLDALANTSTGDMAAVIGALDGSGSAGNARQLEPMADNSLLETAHATMAQFINNVLSRFDNVAQIQTKGITSAITGATFDTTGIWAQGFDTYLHQDPRGLSNGYNANVWGVSLGFDTPLLDNAIVGISGGYARDNVRTKDNSGRSEIDSYSGSLYGSYAKDAYYLDLIASFAYNAYDSSRHIAFGDIDRIPTADYGGQQYSGYMEGGYTFKNGNATLTPLASLQYSHLHIDSYTEENANSVNLSVAGQDYDLLQSGLGAKLAYKMAFKEFTIIPDLHFKWLYDFIGDNQQTTSTFTGGGASFATNAFDPAQSSYDFGTKLIILTKLNVSLTVNYDFELKEDFYSHAGYLNLRYDF